MAYSLAWLPSILTNAGLKVTEVPGWEERGHGDMEETVGVICHHTAGAPTGNMPSLKTLINGRPDLSGPIAQLGLGRDGTYYIIAAGKCYHAGTGSWKGFDNGNAHFIGVEAENTGLANDFPWPEIQMNAYHRGVAAILKYLNRTEEYCVAHKEYALPPGRKPDPNFDMNEFRFVVRSILNSGTQDPMVTPSIEITTYNNLPVIRRGSRNRLVKFLQKKLGVKETGVFNATTEYKLREFQTDNGLSPDGITGPGTWKKLIEMKTDQ
jgi:peptidoglycan hydrolase-like protein with peptidoglycan-binding domain